jgi:hypothetical protein
MSNDNFEEKINKTRTLPIPSAKNIADLPDGYQPTDPAARAAKLLKVDKKLEAELHDALQECGAIGADLPTLLGEYAPAASEANTYAQELTDVQNLLDKLELLTAYAQERKAILLSDGRGYVAKVKRNYDFHIEQKPGLAARFPKFIGFFRAIGEAISEGRAEAKKKREADKPEEK